MKLIYVASPYHGEVEENRSYAKQCCLYVMQQGNNFFCPHLYYTNFLEDEILEERALGMRLGQDMLARCDELWVFGSRISKGMEEEIEVAKKRKMPIRYERDFMLANEAIAADTFSCKMGW